MKYYNTIIIYNLFTSLFLKIISQQLGKNTGAYLKTPDSKLQYRNGNSLDKGFEFNYNIPDLLKNAGFNTIRKNIEKQEIDKEELEIFQKIKESGISDMIGYLKPEKYYIPNLYKPIWSSDNEVNSDNYWANFTFNAITKYKDYIKIWTIYLEPDSSKEILHPPYSPEIEFSYFQFIRMLRITYEIAKKIDTECWVSVSTSSNYEFLDALMRYTDNPSNGEIDENYTDYGGAYFDCVGFGIYPDGKAIDIATNETENGYGSDSLTKKIIIIKKNLEYITKKYDFGIKYPKKIFINEETGLKSMDSSPSLEIRRINWILKLSLRSLEYDIKQNHNIKLVDQDKMGGYGDYEKSQNSYEQLKSSSKARRILRKINLEKFVYEQRKTEILRQNLPEGMFGIVLKRQFPKEIQDEYDYDYIYSLWLLSEKEEIEEKKNYKLNIPFNPLVINYKEVEEKVTNSSEIQISSTPIFLLGNIDHEENEENDEYNKNKENKENGEENNNIIFIFSLILCLIIILIVVGLLFLFFIKFKKKQNNDNFNNKVEKVNNMELLDKYKE